MNYRTGFLIFLSFSILLAPLYCVKIGRAASKKEVQQNLQTLLTSRACVRCNLRGLNLSRYDLSGVDLRGADLSDCNLKLVNLSGANLSGARLRRALLHGADMGESNLTKTDLRDVKGASAYLAGAITTDAVASGEFAERLQQIRQIKEEVNTRKEEIEESEGAVLLPSSSSSENNQDLEDSDEYWRDDDSGDTVVAPSSGTFSESTYPFSFPAQEMPLRSNIKKDSQRIQLRAIKKKKLNRALGKDTFLNEFSNMRGNLYETEQEIVKIHSISKKRKREVKNKFEEEIDDNMSYPSANSLDGKKVVMDPVTTLPQRELSNIIRIHPHKRKQKHLRENSELYYYDREDTPDSSANSGVMLRPSAPAAKKIPMPQKKDDIFGVPIKKTDKLVTNPLGVENKATVFETKTAKKKGKTQKPHQKVESLHEEELALLRQEKRCYKCNFSKLDLRGFDLHNADLEGSNLRGCNLRGVDLAGSNLKGVNMEYADLSGANLKGADLYKAHLNGTNLKGANLKGALFDGSYLDGVIGLDIMP